MNYRVFAHSRSGHHAFINWLMSNVNGSSCFYNSVDWNNKGVVTSKSRKKIIGKAPFTTNIYSFEYFDINDYHNYSFNEWDGEFTDIIFLRDFPNWLASSHKIKPNDKRFYQNWEYFNGKIQMPIIDLWEQYAQFFIDNSSNTNFILVKYNDWFLNKEYRSNLSKKLKINNQDVALKKISEYGGGSSYSKFVIRDVDKNSLKTYERWKNHLDDDVYVSLLKNNVKCLELNEKLFNMKIESFDPLKIIKL